ncbi:MAG: hypothetical protein JOZ77_11820 [Candidatus Eremiobacteraeota bacterium]|nr:hypothetical protein [Candidatus Eremiobacteraeota bacterium]
MTIAVVLASQLFLHAFGGAWSCAVKLPESAYGPAKQFTESMRIAALPGGQWAQVRWSEPRRSGTALVGRFEGSPMWIYDDYWDDGHFYRDLSRAPDAAGNWRWFDTDDQVHMNPTEGPQTWRRISPTTFTQVYNVTHAGVMHNLGSAVCTRR